MKSALMVRRAELIQQIAMERDVVAHSWNRTLHRVESFGYAANQVRQLLYHPSVVVALAIGIWMIGWNRSIKFLNHASMGWNVWRHISERQHK
jgi:hypothetical protein